MTFGYFGESLRTLDDINFFYKSPYSLREMIREIHCKSNIEKYCFHSDTIYDFIEEEMLPLTEGMDKENLTRDDVFRLFTYSRFETNTSFYRLANMFTYSFEVFAQKAFIDANLSIPYEWRDGDYFSLSLTKLFCPKLLEFPFFSHGHFVYYDPASNTVKGSATHRLRGNMIHYLVKDHPALYKFLRCFYRAAMFLSDDKKSGLSENDQKISQLSMKAINESPTIAHSKLKVVETKQYVSRITGLSATRQAYGIPHVAAAIKVADTLTEEQ